MTAVRTDHVTAVTIDRVSRRWVGNIQGVTDQPHVGWSQEELLDMGLEEQRSSGRLMNTGLLNMDQRRMLDENRWQMVQARFTPEQPILDEAEHERVPSQFRTHVQRGRGWDGE